MGSTPFGATPSATPFGMGSATPFGSAAMGMETPAAGFMDPAQLQAARWERELDDRNRPQTDDELDALFPQEGYVVLDPPASYVPIQTPARRLAATPTPMGGTPIYQMPSEDRNQRYDLPPTPAGNLPAL